MIFHSKFHASPINAIDIGYPSDGGSKWAGFQQMYSTGGVVIDVTSSAFMGRFQGGKNPAAKLDLSEVPDLKQEMPPEKLLGPRLLVGLAGRSGSCRDEIRNMLSSIKMRSNLCILAFFVNSVQCICRIGWFYEGNLSTKWSEMSQIAMEDLNMNFEMGQWTSINFQAWKVSTWAIFG